MRPSSRGSVLLRIAVIGGVLAAAVAIIVLVGDVTDARGEFSHLGWSSIALLIPVAVASYLARYLRWQALTEVASELPVPHRPGGAVFAAGSLLIFTPARAGEAAKSLYARDLMGIPVSASLPVLAAERVNDVAVMMVLAAIGLVIVGAITDLLTLAIIAIAIAALAFVIVLVLQKATTAERPWDRFGAVAFIRESLTVSERLMKRRALAVNSTYGMAAWAGEVAIYYLALTAVGEPFGGDTFVLALAIYPLASLGGALSLVPAGLGVTEGGLVGLAVVVGDVGGETALAAALIARAAVLGSVVLFGLLALPFVRSGRGEAVEHG